MAAPGDFAQCASPPLNSPRLPNFLRIPQTELIHQTTFFRPQLASWRAGRPFWEPAFQPCQRRTHSCPIAIVHFVLPVTNRSGGGVVETRLSTPANFRFAQKLLSPNPGGGSIPPIYACKLSFCSKTERETEDCNTCCHWDLAHCCIPPLPPLLPAPRPLLYTTTSSSTTSSSPTAVYRHFLLYYQLLDHQGLSSKPILHYRLIPPSPISEKGGYQIPPFYACKNEVVENKHKCLSSTSPLRHSELARMKSMGDCKSTNLGRDRLISADRNNKATLLLTILRCTFKSSAKDLSPRIMTLLSAGKHSKPFRNWIPLPACYGSAAEALFVSNYNVRG